MIRWKILRQSINSLLGVILLWSCSDKKIDSEQDIFLEFSERKEFLIGWDGLYNSTYAPFHLDDTWEKGLIYNYMNHSLDSIFFEKDSAYSKTGEPMEVEGPSGVGKIGSFFVWKDTIVLFTVNEFFFKSLETGQVKKKLIKNYPEFKDNVFMSIRSSSIFENRFTSFDSEDDKAIFFISDEIQMDQMIWKFDFQNDLFEKIPIKLDTIKLKNYSPKFRIKRGSISGMDAPSLSLINQKLILSFPGFCDFIVFELQDQSQRDFSYESGLFPLERVISDFPSEELEIREAIDLSSAWQNQVTFGPFGYLEKEEVYFRLVVGPKQENSQQDADIFIEIFDKGFNKLVEKNLSSINQDIKRNYAFTKHGLALIAKDQPDEDVMYFYYLDILRSK
ncbi:MAG: DUF4221 domain-containing protein [Cytophagales bacterium]|uniref:DUF4221 domain-containing protein n=1 Tax=Algoriphagus taiwanensis TaxID=1445656 RepID=A0ABQ6PZH6_9BACT|nr:MAG: DUF4221 domain-containing protein [Cytophagales bacterium]GMQ33356.1 hypothetical protein Ataiwa_16280 [Algoriphagus taiwanensis]